MNISEIVVGKRYRLIYGNEQIFLGIGMRKLNTSNEYTEKHLVIIESNDKDSIGKMVQEGVNASDNFWDSIVEEDCGLFVWYCT